MRVDGGHWSTTTNVPSTTWTTASWQPNPGDFPSDFKTFATTNFMWYKINRVTMHFFPSKNVNVAYFDIAQTGNQPVSYDFGTIVTYVDPSADLLVGGSIATEFSTYQQALLNTKARLRDPKTAFTLSWKPKVVIRMQDATSTGGPVGGLSKRGWTEVNNGGMDDSARFGLVSVGCQLPNNQYAVGEYSGQTYNIVYTFDVSLKGLNW